MEGHNPAGGAIRAGATNRVYRKARKAQTFREDEVLNAICDSRSKEARLPLDKLLDKVKHGLAE